MSITIGDGAFVGVEASIIPGISAGEYAIVAGGAAVTSDVPARTLAADVSAAIKKILALGAKASDPANRRN